MPSIGDITEVENGKLLEKCQKKSDNRVPNDSDA